ncbi:MAG: hypothetical protein BJ554DRAFT_1611 [Olpidium bornovanus]|uniref:Uncharacterized protein n=1 Tax=Olpidium bornovanus TaxID=278681 RepID=A0A8H7ZSE4_9FUNG|nr:MAG: hypothetical protein BJ554DRAFT_1611 [Olpidium bornovanus]
MGKRRQRRSLIRHPARGAAAPFDRTPRPNLCA